MTADIIQLARVIRARSRIASLAGDKSAAYRLAREADKFEQRPMLVCSSHRDLSSPMFMPEEIS